MKIGFSSVCAPSWNFRMLLEQAVKLGFDGIELRGLEGELHLPQHPELANNTEAVVQACEGTGVQIVCLGSSASFGLVKMTDIGDQKAVVREYIELAERLRCPYVRVFSGDVPAGMNRRHAIERISVALSELADFAARHRVTLVVENSGELGGSKDIWTIVDAVAHPALRACWNVLHGLSVNDHPGLALPRLGARLGMMHITDANLEDGVLSSYEALGKGNTDVAHTIELLTGIGYDGYLMVEWPKLWNDALSTAEEFLPSAAEFLKSQLSIERKPLTAYKGDKNKPEFASPPPRTALDLP